MSEPYLVSLLGQLPDQSSSLNSLLLSLEAQARVLLDKIGKASANGSVPKSGKSTEKVTDKTSDDKLARSVQMFPQMLKLVSIAVVLKCSNAQMQLSVEASSYGLSYLEEFSRLWGLTKHLRLFVWITKLMESHDPLGGSPGTG